MFKGLIKISIGLFLIILMCLSSYKNINESLAIGLTTLFIISCAVVIDGGKDCDKFLKEIFKK